jgi:hypothetical protein
LHFQDRVSNSLPRLAWNLHTSNLCLPNSLRLQG